MAIARELSGSRERSRAYPGAPLPECVDCITKIRKSFGSGELDRAIIAKALGVAEATVTRLVAAMVHFGLLERAGGSYVVSSLGRVLADPLDHELEPALKTAVRNPTLYDELFRQYEHEGRLPQKLSTILNRNFGIAANAADLAAKILIKSAIYAGLIDESLAFVEVESPTSALSSELAVIAPTPLPATARTARESVWDGPDGQQTFLLKLSHGYASISVPSEMTERDLALIRKQLEILEMQMHD